MNKLLVAAVLAVLAVTASAQNQSTTTTEAKRPGDPIPGMDVKLVQADGTVLKTTQTTATGQIEFSGIKPGSYVLKVGKETTETTIQSPRDVATGQASGKSQTTDAPDDKAGAEQRTINTSRSNIKNQAAPVQTDEPQGPNVTLQTKAGVSTSRSNIRTKAKSNLQVPEDEEIIVVQLTNDVPPEAKRSFVLPHVLEKSGLRVQVKADGRLPCNILKTRHDTVKNSINNVR